LNADENNKAALRIRVSAEAEEKDIEGIIETLKLFDQKYRKRIRAYPHILFPACSEMWCNESGESCITNSENTREREAINLVYKIADSFKYYITKKGMRVISEILSFKKLYLKTA